MAGMAIAFVLSRTTGLPGFKESGWDGLGILTLVLEGGFVAAAIAALSRSGAPARTAPAEDDVRFSHDPATRTRGTREPTGVR
jgi:hypothetical protein